MIDPKFSFPKVPVDFTEDVQRRVNDLTASIAAEVARQTDMAICRQLVAMGWTPPADVQALLDAEDNS